MFEKLLEPVLNPLLTLHPFWIVLIISLIVSVIITVIYKLMTDQDLMKTLKAEMKEFQKETKELKDHPEKAMEVQQKAMKTNMKYMGLSMKPTLVTFIPIIIIFGWLTSHLAYYPIIPNQEFMITATFKDASGTITLAVPEGLTIISDHTQTILNNQAKWVLKGDTGEYLLEYEFEGNKHTQELLITDELAYKQPIKPIKDAKLKSLNINNEKLKVLNLFGWKLGWLGTYIIFSLIFSMLLRKWMKLA